MVLLIIVLLELLGCLIVINGMKKYNAIVREFEVGHYESMEKQLVRIWQLWKIVSIIPGYKTARLIYNHCCYILASLALMEGEEQKFLKILKSMKSIKGFAPELQGFMLAVYYFSKKNIHMAEKYYKSYLLSFKNDSDIQIIMNKLFSERGNLISEGELLQAVNNFKSPVIAKMLREAGLLLAEVD